MRNSMKGQPEPRTMMGKNLRIRPAELRDANAFIGLYHRHLGWIQGHRFSLGLWDGDRMVGVICVGRPAARMTDQRTVVEVSGLCTDGTPNACSKLYAAAARIGKEMGYRKIQTFILGSEPGTSLRAAGWTKAAESRGGRWDRPSRPRADKAPLGRKVRYEKIFLREK